MALKSSRYPGFRFVRKEEGISEYLLVENGLRVLIQEDHSLPIAVCMVTYHVGSRNESTGLTGATHFLEHLMFKGSRRFPLKKGKDLSAVLERLGAQVNATTWFDRTNYYVVTPSEHLPVVIAMEADRMRHAHLREEDRRREMTIVRNEFERGENLPLEVLDKHIWATAFMVHPYRHPTIGWRSDIEGVSIERLQEFYNTFYWPNNATLTLVGDVEPERAFADVRKHFGRLRASSHLIPTIYSTEPTQTGERRVAVRRVGTTELIGLAWKAPAGLHKNTPAIQVASQILGAGRVSRLYRALVLKGLASEVFVEDLLLKDPGLLIVYAFATPGTSLKKIEAVIRNEIAAMKEKGVGGKEVEAARAKLATSIAFSRDGVSELAMSLNEAIALGDWRFYLTFLEQIRSVSATQVQEAVRRYCTDEALTVGYYLPS